MKKFLALLFIIFTMSTSSVFADNEQTLIIFDSSISMGEDFFGSPKYIVAVQQAKKVLNTMSNDRNIGLRTIGVKFDVSILNYLQDPKNMCKATQLEVPIRQNNIEYISNALDEIFPLGTTPLEYTLRTAINSDFSNNSSELKHIILITDGAESCDGDPCAFVRTFLKYRHDITIDIIAISVNNEDFLQLKCLSDSTNGRIINVSNPEELQNAYSKVLPSYNSGLKTQANNINHQINNNNYVKMVEPVTYKNYLFETYE